MEEKEVCLFCKELKLTKEIMDDHKKARNRPYETKTEYRVALVTQHYDNPNYPDWCTGSHTHQSMELNFCPVCGRKIELEGE